MAYGLKVPCCQALSSIPETCVVGKNSSKLFSGPTPSLHTYLDVHRAHSINFLKKK